MNRGGFNEAWKWLEKYQGRSLGDFAVSVYWKEFENTDEAAFSRAIIKSYEKFPPGRFPTISDLRNLLSVVRETNWEKEKQVYDHPPVQRSDMGREAIALVSRLWADSNHVGKIDSYQLATEMIMDMEKKYPGQGWETKGRGLLKWLEKYEENKEKRKEKNNDEESADNSTKE